MDETVAAQSLVAANAKELLSYLGLRGFTQPQVDYVFKLVDAIMGATASAAIISRQQQDMADDRRVAARELEEDAEAAERVRDLDARFDPPVPFSVMWYQRCKFAVDDVVVGSKREALAQVDKRLDGMAIDEILKFVTDAGDPEDFVVKDLTT